MRELFGNKVLRYDLIRYLIKEYNLKKMAEIGVFHAELSLKVLQGNTILDEYILVDKCYRNRVTVVLSKYKIAKMFVMTSLQAAFFIPNDYLDLVFIDAEHTKEAIREDLKAWIPKVKIGGWILGHDYSDAIPAPYPGYNEVIDYILPKREIVPEVLDKRFQRSCFLKRKDGNERI